MITPALLEAAVELRGAEYKLYGKLHGILVATEYRAVKLWPIANEMRMNRATVGKAFKELLKQGYIREGPRQADGVRSYCIIPVRGTPIGGRT